MKINVLKFGGSSVKDNKCLRIVAEKILKFKKKGEGIVAVVSAQGKRTDELIKGAEELGYNRCKRELDFLLSIGEIESAAKLSILLNGMGYKAIALNGLQTGIETSSDFGKARIIDVNVNRILKEINEGKIVIVTGFQGIDKNNNFTTLGRGGSDTSCVALAVKLGAKECYIFSDVDGVYSADPNVVNDAKKLQNVTYSDMENAAFEGAKVLCERSVSLADKYGIKIIASSTFTENTGTEVIGNISESNSIKNNDTNLARNNITKNADKYKENIKVLKNNSNKEKNVKKIDEKNNIEKLEELEEYNVKMYVKNNKVLKAEINEITLEKLDSIISEINAQKIKIKKVIVIDNNTTKALELSKKVNTNSKNKNYIGNLENKSNEKYESKNQIMKNVILIFNDSWKNDITKIFKDEKVNEKIENITEYSFIGSGISNNDNLATKILNQIRKDVSMENLIFYEVNANQISIYFNNK